MTEKQSNEYELFIKELEAITHNLNQNWRILNGKIDKQYHKDEIGNINRINFNIELAITQKLKMK